MVKKVLVKYDELGKPIELVELKEFTDPSALKAYKQQCDANKVEYNKRLAEKEQNAKTEITNVYCEILDVRREIKLLKSVILHVLGYAELTDEQLSEILGIEIVNEPEETEPEEEPEEVE